MTSSSSLYGTATTQNVSSTNSTSLYGEAGTPVPDSSGNVVVRGDLYVLSGNILTTATTGNIFPTNATTINIGLAATAFNIGATTGITTINNQLATGNYTFPLADGTVNQVLTTNGAGVLSFTDVGSLDTNYNISASSTLGGANLDLTGSDSTVDSVSYIGSSGVTVTADSASSIGIAIGQPVAPTDTVQFQSLLVSGGTGYFETGIGTSVTLNQSNIQIGDGSSGPNGFTIAGGSGHSAYQYFDSSTDTFKFESDASGNLLTLSPTAATFAKPITLNGSSSGGSTFAAPATGSTLSYVLPGSAGAANTVLTNNGSGTLTWALPGGGGSTFGNISIGVTTDNTINTTTGDLILQSATGEIDTNTTNILSTNSASFLLLNSPTTVTAFNGATTLNFGAATGTTNINNSLLVDVNATVTGDLAVNGGDITTTATTANLFTTAATTINIGGAGNGTSTGIINLGVAGQTYFTSVNGLIIQNSNTTQDSTKLLNQTSTSPILLTSTARRSMKCIVTINDDITGEVHSVELLIVRKVSTSEAFVTIYAEIFSNAPLATFTVTDTGTALNLYATKASSNSTDIYVLRNSLGVSL